MCLCLGYCLQDRRENSPQNFWKCWIFQSQSWTHYDFQHSDYSCILLHLKHLKSSPSPRKKEKKENPISFTLSLSNAITLKWISPLLVKISISKSASLSSYLFCFPWLSCSEGGKKILFMGYITYATGMKLQTPGRVSLVWAAAYLRVLFKHLKLILWISKALSITDWIFLWDSLWNSCDWYRWSHNRGY